MGDLPFVVGLDSADVWANRALFRLDQRLGTPPDEASPEGRTGACRSTTGTRWSATTSPGSGARAKRAGELYSLYRVDHAVGFYRTYFRSTDGRTERLHAARRAGPDRSCGERLMRIMSRFGEVIAEDLGALPAFLRPSLERIGVARLPRAALGTEGDDFRDPASWPAISVATNATHDTDTTADWYDALTPRGARAAAAHSGAGRARSVPSRSGRRRATPPARALRVAVDADAGTLFQDALGERQRINTPGTVGEKLALPSRQDRGRVAGRSPDHGAARRAGQGDRARSPTKRA